MNEVFVYVEDENNNRTYIGNFELEGIEDVVKERLAELGINGKCYFKVGMETYRLAIQRGVRTMKKVLCIAIALATVAAVAKAKSQKVTNGTISTSRVILKADSVRFDRNSFIPNQ